MDRERNGNGYERERESLLREIEALNAELARAGKREAEIRHDLARCGDVLSSLRGWYWEVDERFQFTWCSDRVLEIIGYTPGEMVERSPLEFIFPEDRPRFRRAMEEVIHLRRPFQNVECWVFARDGGRVCFLSSGVPYYTGEGVFRGYRGICQKLKGRSQMELVMSEVRDLALALGSVRDLTEGLALCLRTALSLSGMDAGGVYRLDPADHSLRLVVQEGLPSGFIERVSVFPADSLITRLVMVGEPIYSRASEADPAVADISLPEGLSLVAVVPILHQGKVIGCFEFASHALDIFPALLTGIVEALLAPVGNAIARLQSERAIRESEERLRLALTGADLGTWDWQVPGGETAFDARWAEMLGYGPEEIESHVRAWERLIHPDDLARVLAVRDAHLEGKTDGYETEHRLRHKSGEWIWVLDRGRVIERDAGGRPLRVCGTHLDITGRKRAEEALRESEATLRSVFRAAPVGICFIRGRQVVSVNDALCRALGRSEGEMLGGNTRRSYFSDAEFEAVGRDLYGQIHRKGRGSVETRLRRKDGSEIQVILTGGMLQADNPSQGYVITVHDITDRKRAEGEREHTLSILRATLESTEDGILVVGKAGAVSGYNHRFLDIWGLSEERLSGMDDMKLLDYTKALVADPEAFRRQVMRYYDFPEEDGSGAIEMRDGRVLEWYSRPQRMGEAVVGRIWSFRDTTGRRRLEQQLLQAQKMEIVGRLAGGVAHDFNNILTVINGTADVVLLFASPDNPYYESFDEIRKAGERGANLTRQLLAFSRCQSVEPRVVSLNQILLDMNKMLRRLIGEHIELTTILDEGLLPVKVDPGHIEQVFTNLAVNARAAMPEGGKLTIETGNLEIGPESPDARPGLPPGKYVLFAVTDTGVGMEPEILPLIFKPFFTTKPRGKGTGLGLATCHGIVKQSGGDIEVESAPGRGTTFRVYLPAFEGETAELFASREASEIAAGTETVLVVEDDPMVSAVVSGLLESAGYRVLSASNGEDARSLMERTPETVHLLVTDVVMPLMGGNELAAHLTALRPGLKVLFMSGYTDYSILRENILEPGSRFIQKPFSSAAFLQKVRETLDG